MITAVQCRFKREEDSEWECGLAITSKRGVSNVLIIMPQDGTTQADIPTNIWYYRLLWNDGILELEVPQ
jgi:hypothetical protein